MTNFDALLADFYNTFEGSEALRDYSERHGIESASVLTFTTDETAHAIACHLAPHIEGRTVVEIGGGLGLLAIHMGQFATRVYCIEANPMWAPCFTLQLLHVKPKNVSYLFGAADEFAGLIKADVALFCTHSGVAPMGAAAALFADEVIDVYGEIIREAPERFDFVARTLREVA